MIYYYSDKNSSRNEPFEKQWFQEIGRKTFILLFLKFGWEISTQVFSMETENTI